MRTVYKEYLKRSKLWIIVVYPLLLVCSIFYWITSNNVTTFSKEVLVSVFALSTLLTVASLFALFYTKKWLLFMFAAILAFIITLLNYFSLWISGYVF